MPATRLLSSVGVVLRALGVPWLMVLSVGLPLGYSLRDVLASGLLRLTAASAWLPTAPGPAPTRTSASTALQGGRRASESVSKLPRIVQIGAQKSGTTFISSLLARHPELKTCCVGNRSVDTREGGFLLDVRSVHTREGNMSRKRAAEERKRYAAALEHCSRPCASQGAVFFDDKPEYLADLDGQRLVSTLQILPPRTVFVLSMRDPLDRMVSSMGMESCRHGIPILGCYTRYFTDRMREMRPDNAFVKKGRYGTHLKRWLKYVPRERMLLFYFEEVVNDTLGVLNQILRAAGLRALDALPTIEKSAALPFDTRECKSSLCGAPATKRLKAAAAKSCWRIREFYEPEIRDLGSIVGRDVPASWRSCEN